MKILTKLLLSAGLMLQVSGMIFADNWSDAFAAFGGAQNVWSHRGGPTAGLYFAEAKKQAAALGTPEALAVAMFMSRGTDNALAPKFVGAASREELLSVLNDTLNPVRSVPVAAQAPAQQPSRQAPGQQPASGGWMSWMSGSSSAQPADMCDANVQAAMQQQKAIDAAAAAQNNQALANLVNSNASGFSLYKGYIDVIFNLLQNAVGGIVDPAVQQQVISYIQSQLQSMKASVAAANQYNSRSLGRMNSKKAAKAVKKSHKKA